MAIVLFDGVCNLCSGSVQFILKRDPKKLFQFASLQSPAARKLLEGSSLDPSRLDTLILIENGKPYIQSDAVLRIAQNLSAPWPAFAIFRILPKFLRDFLYRLVVKNRYRIFGKKEVCWVPDSAWKARFLD